MDGAILFSTATECLDFLHTHAGEDWEAPVPGMDFTVAGVVAHTSTSLLYYGADLAAGARELSTTEVKVRAAPPGELIRTLGMAARVLAAVVDSSPPEARGWHPWGVADPSGFLGMACDELLVHTADAGRGLGVEFVPREAHSRALLARMFPWAPDDLDAWQTLLWANGRADLPGHPRPQDWRWHCAPLSEWDGTRPVAV
ncbi:maleylpyruvate isomerase N-terminal domain-containing protein [Actinokineospora auranticolor]|uniref:Mycothiol maleylpyruvate isomerase-like protein n=1 Tax=Actinokineospora auranticolor TaxID=155976 RepID=A0A2S6GGP9_9PSEU|nr:maleylpyruvate isomerase N-terminal domain-containing protein [Actinokineospora auranticolor]PPK64379.1 mycothiol maleylpyruvate isomerase-like protein [Actinokineospora auranticolor]